MIRHGRFLVAGMAAVALLLSACGGGGGSSPTEATTGPTGEPVQGGSADVLMLSEPRTLDPAAMGNNTNSASLIGNALYGALLVDDAETGEITGSLAESFTTTDGGTTFDLVLREGVTFSDGTPFTAEAVKFGWDRMKDQAVGSPYLGDASTVASTEVVDERTLRATLVQPVPNFGFTVITSTMNWIGSPTALQGDRASYDAAPVGAGPFVLEEWRRQDVIELTRNPAYVDAPRPYLDSITARVATEAPQRVNTVISGGADLAQEVNWQNLERATAGGLVTYDQGLSGGTYLAMNTRRAPFDDPRAREAVSAALDPQALNVSVYNDTAEPVTTLFSETSPLFSDVPASPPDAARAQQLFDELAAEGKPVSFTFTSTSSSESRSTAESIQAQLSAFENVTVEILTVDFAQYLPLQTSHDFDAIVSSAVFPDPEPRMWSAFHSGSTSNMSGISDPALDAALLAGRTATTVEERRAAYEQVQQLFNELHPGSWLTRMATSVITSDEVGGVQQYGYGSLLADGLWIQE